MNRDPDGELSVMARRHQSEELLREALIKESEAKTWLGKFVAGRVVAYREHQADQSIRSIEN